MIWIQFTFKDLYIFYTPKFFKLCPVFKYIICILLYIVYIESIDSPRLKVIQLWFSWLYHDAKVMHIQSKPYFKLWILLFSWASNMKYYTLMMLGSHREDFAQL